MTEIDAISSLDKAMRNSYVLITGGKTLKELMQGDEIIFAHNVEKPIEIKDIEEVIKYFEELEEYEKCSKLDFMKELIGALYEIKNKL